MLKLVRTKFNSCNGFHTTAVVLSPNEDIVQRALKIKLNENIQLNRLAIIKYEKNQNIIEELGGKSVSNTAYEESFPWFVRDGKIIDYNQKIKLDEGMELASKFLTSKLGVAEGDISKIKIKDILQPWPPASHFVFIEGKEPTILSFYEHLSVLFKKDKENFKDLSTLSSTNDISQGLDKVSRSIGDMTLNEVYMSCRNLNFPIKDVSINIDMFKFIPRPPAIHFVTIFIFRSIVKTYINAAYPLSDIHKMEPRLREEHMIMRGKATRLWACYFAPIATATILVFVQKLNPITISNISVRDTFSWLHSDSISSSGVDKDANTSIKNAFLYLFLSNKLKTFSLNLKNMSTGQLFKFIFKTLSIYLLIFAFIYYNIDFNVLLINLVKISLYDLAKIWLVGNIGVLLYFISSFIIYVYYCKLLDKGEREENIRISIYWPSFISNWLKSLLILSTGTDKFKIYWIRQYWINIFCYSCSVSLLTYYLLA